MNFESFLSQYSTDFLSSIDINLHQLMLSKYFNLFGVKDNLIFFDVGANAGSFIKVSKKLCNPTIHSFEPHPFLSKFLKKTYDDIIVNELCVSDTNGESYINIPSLSVGISSMVNRKIFNDLKKTQDVFNLKINTITLDTYCQNNNINHIDYIKIDVEGFEYQVLNGCRHLLDSGKISAGQFEIGIEESGYSTIDIINLLENRGYVIDNIDKDNLFFYKQP